MKLFIITGASGGLGLALSELALSQGDLVIGLSRRSVLKHENFYPLKHDLSRSIGLEKKLDQLLEKLNLRRVKSVHLINNAAGIEPVGLVGKLSTEGIQHQLALNLTAPMMLANYVIKRFKSKAFITNIISGAAVKPISGWSLYCSTKSGLRMFTECLTSEGVKAISFSPGIMDTSMQATIRKQKPKDFDRVNEFKEYKDKDMLLSADEVATLLMSLLNAPDSIKKVHYSVND
ncbi:MAG: SDR family NAD(P)-dependent oxidoreductase [Bacteriovoracaceae bacterium]|nr:SDR family NAD(P)-dependent oxidoreductase [Bacteriovoracaceae bacterium]